MTAPVLVFGATGGVGSALVRRLARQGVPVHLAARGEDRLAALAGEIAAGFTVCDVLDDAALAQAVVEASPNGALSGLAFCVGSIPLAPLRRQTRQAYRDAFELNAVSAAEALRHAAPALKAGKGAAVLFSSVAVSQGFANHAAISAAKGAVEGLTRAIAVDLAPEARINAIAPSLMRTDLAKSFTSSEPMAEAIAQLHALPRLGEGEDAAALAAFLLGPEASWITGQVFAVDGGRSHVRAKG